MMERKKLYGRDREVQQLRDVFQSIKSDGTSDVIIVSGLSGTGKTTLVETTFENEDCLYGSGKFEMEEVSTPFASLSSAISSIGQAILETDTKKYEDLIKSSLTSDDIKKLTCLVPVLHSIVPGYCNTCAKAPKMGTKACFEHFKYALRLLLRTVSTQDRPVVLFMDDLQWIDEMTLQILKSILSDPDIKHFVLVGAYREDEMDADHIVSSWIAEDVIDVIELANINPIQIAEALSDILETKENIQELADLFYSRTSGNAFHMMQLVDFIKNHNNPKLLEYSPTRFRYVWNIKDIRQFTSLSDNIVGMIVAKIHQLPEAAQSFLQLASCFGSRFDMRILLILEGESISSSLNIAIEQGLLERIADTSSVIKFVHDKVYQAAVDLVPSDERTKMHYGIGKKLLYHYCGDQNKFADIDDAIFFTCVDQLNLGKDFIDCKNFRLRLAKLNCEAVVRAASFSAFLAAVKYANIGISLLDKNTMWTDEYSFCLELHSLLAEVSSNCGQIEQLDIAASEVFEHAKTIDDKLRAHFAVFMGKTKDLGATINEYFNLLEELGEGLPRDQSKVKALACIIRTHRSLESSSDDEILKLPPMKCMRKISSVRIVSMLVDNLIHNDKFCQATMLLSNMVAITLKEGLSEYTPLIMAQYGSLLISFDKSIKMACRLGTLAIKLLDVVEASPIARVAVYTHTLFLTHWQQPLSLHLDQRIEMYQDSLRLGDLRGAFTSIITYGMEYFYSGLPLPPLVQDMRKFVEQMASYGQPMYLFTNLPLYQAVLNLTGESENVLDMCKAKEMLEYREKHKWDGKTGIETSWSYGMQIAFFCGDMETANAYANNLKRTDTMSCRKRLPWYFGHVRVFFFSLIAIDNYRRTRKRKYLREAKRYKSRIEECVREGSINLPHKLQILEAEIASVRNPSLFSRTKRVSADSLQSLYDKAIAHSKRSGFLQDAALCAQLAGRALNVDDNRYRVMESELLESWGATAVIRHHQDKRLSMKKGYLTESNTTLSSGSTGYRARSRFIEGIQKEGVEFSSVEVPFIQAT